MSIVAVHHNPWHPGKDIQKIVANDGNRIRELAPSIAKPYICLVNGEVILRKDWIREIGKNDIVQFVVLPQGGGGSNPLRMILMLAVMVFAPYIAEALLPVGASAFATSLTTAVIGMVGAVLVNVLVPPKSLSNSVARSESASPTYSLAAQGNSARIGEPIPVQYGRHIAWPDFAASPYVEYSGNEQYLYQLFCIGLGEYDIEAIRIEDTDISQFAEVSTEIIQPGGKLTLFPANVETSGEVSGQEMETGKPLGAFVANEADTTANALAFDVVCTRGLYYANDSGSLSEMSVSFRCEARQIDDYGTALGDWMVLGSEVIKAATSTPQRRSYRYAVLPGRYEARITRTDTKNTNSRAGHEICWASLRAYLEDAGTVYPGMTLLAVRIRATNNISQQASRKINVIATRKLPVWNPETGWSAPVATRSIAWAFADACKAEYSAKLNDGRIDLPALYELDRIWTGRGDYLDIRFDTKTTVWEALTTIARAGRAKPFRQGGMIRIVRDQPQSVPSGMFTMRNIVKGSFKVQYLMPTEETADAVDIEYFDARIWKWKTVKAKMPDSIAEKPVTVKLLGVTNRDQAWREGMYMAACNRFRRRVITLSTEMEGFIPTMGDLCIVAHDMPQWGQSASVKAYDHATRTLTLTEPLTWKDGETHYIALRRPNGSVFGPAVVTKGETENQCVIAEGSEPDFTIRTGDTSEPTHTAFGWGETWRQPARALSLKPRGVNKVEIELVGEDDAVHLADTGNIPPETTHTQLPITQMRPILTGLIVRSMPNASERAVLSWEPSPWAEYYYIEQSSDMKTWTRSGESSAPNFSCIALYGNATYFRVCAAGIAVGPWAMVAYSSGSDYMWNPDESKLMWNADETALMWKN